jgi:hypothetical protein
MRTRIRNILLEAYDEPKRFRPSSYHAFKNPLTGEDGSQIIGYEWEYEWIETVDKRGEDIQIRVSDWSNAHYNEQTGRMIVHLFHVKLSNGETVITSAEKASELVGFPIRKIRSEVDKQMRIEDKERIKQQTKQDIIAGTAQLTVKQAKKAWNDFSSDDKIQTCLAYIDRHPELLTQKIDFNKLFNMLKNDEPRHILAPVIDFREYMLSYLNNSKSFIRSYGYTKDKSGANALFWTRFQTPPRTTYILKGKEIPIIDESFFMYHPDGRVMRVHQKYDGVYIPFFEYVGFKK